VGRGPRSGRVVTPGKRLYKEGQEVQEEFNTKIYVNITEFFVLLVTFVVTPPPGTWMGDFTTKVTKDTKNKSLINS
jgi:hypothetical protein